MMDEPHKRLDQLQLSGHQHVTASHSPDPCQYQHWAKNEREKRNGSHGRTDVDGNAIARHHLITTERAEAIAQWILFAALPGSGLRSDAVGKANQNNPRSDDGEEHPRLQTEETAKAYYHKADKTVPQTLSRTDEE